MAWIEFIFAFSDALFGDHRMISCLALDLDGVIRFDPSWKYPYELGGLIFADNDPEHIALAKRYLKSGINKFPDFWKFRVYYAEMLRDENVPADTLFALLSPLTTENAGVPAYARTMAFSVLEKTGGPERAMKVLLQTYELVPDPMIRYQFREKIWQLLRHNHRLSTDSADFKLAATSMLESKDPSDRQTAGMLLVGLVDSAQRDQGMAAAHQLAAQYAAYSKK